MSEQKKELARVALEQRVVSTAKTPFQTTAAELAALSQRYGVPAVDLGTQCIPLSLVQLVPQEIAEIHRLLVVKEDTDGLYVAMENPSDARSLEELSFVLGKSVMPLAVPATDLDAALGAAYLAARRGEANFVGPRYSGPAPEGRLAPELQFVPRAGSADVSTEPHLRDTQASALTGSEVIPQVPDLDFAGTSRAGRSASNTARAKGASASAGAAASGAVAILAINDPELLRVATAVLRPAGAQVVAADSGDKAIESIKQSSPNLVLLEVFLPGANGFDLAVRLRSSRRFATLPVVLLSSVQRGPSLVDDARRLGLEHCLQRPTVPELRATVLRLLGAEDRSARAAAGERLQAGLAAFREGDPARAVVELERAAALDPTQSELCFQLGLMQAQRGQVYDAIASLERAASLDMNHFGCMKNLALLYQQVGFTACSRELWQRALHLAPDDATRSSIEERMRSLRA